MADTKIRVSMVLDSAELIAGMKAAGVSVDQFAKSTDKANTETKGFSAWLAGSVAGLVSSLTTKLLELGKAFVDGVAAGAKAAVEAFTGFDKNMRNVNSIAQMSEEEFKKLNKATLDLAVSLGKDPTELSDALFDIYSAGLKGKEALDMLEASVKLGIAGQTDAKTAANGLTTAMALYAKEIGNATNAGDLFSKGQEYGKITTGDLIKEFGSLASTASVTGVSMHETVAALSALTLAGQKSNEAGTNLKQLLTELRQPSESLAVAFEGVTKQTIQSYTAQHGLNGTLRALMELTGGSTEELAKLKMSSSAVAAMAGLAAENYTYFGGALDAVANKTGTMNKQIEEQDKSLSRVMDRWNALKKVILVEIGEKLAPVLGMIVAYVSDIAHQFRAWLENKDNVAKLTELIDVAKVSVQYMFTAVKELAEVFVVAFGVAEKGAVNSNKAIEAMMLMVKLLAIAFKMVLAAISPVIEALGVVAKILTAISEHRWGDAVLATHELMVKTAATTARSIYTIGKAAIESGKDMEEAQKEMTAASVARVQKAEADKLAAMEKAQKEATNFVAKGMTDRAHLSKVDVEAVIEAEKNKESAVKKGAAEAVKAAKEAQKEKAKIIKDEFDQKRDADDAYYRTAMDNYSRMAIGADKYQKQQIAQAKLNDQIRHRQVQEALDREEKAQLAALGKQTANQSAASAKQGGIVTEMLEGVSAKINGMKNNPIDIKANVTGMDELKGIQGGTFDIKGTGFLNNLEAMLKATVHRDFLTMNKTLYQIQLNTAETAKKIPPAARFGGA